MYQEVPSGYLDWVPKQTKANPNAHNDLVRLATWGAAEIHEGLCQEAGLGERPGSSCDHRTTGKSGGLFGWLMGEGWTRVLSRLSQSQGRSDYHRRGRCWKTKPRGVRALEAQIADSDHLPLELHLQELRRLRRKEQAQVNFVSRVFQLKQLMGGIVAVENPRSSALWREKKSPISSTTRAFALQILDLCQYGLKSLADGRP